MKRRPLSLLAGTLLLGMLGASVSTAGTADSCAFARRISYWTQIHYPACPGQTVGMTFHARSDCDHLLSAAVADDGTVYLQFVSAMVCPPNPFPDFDDSITVQIGPFPEGRSTFRIESHSRVLNPDSTGCDLFQTDTAEVFVADCGPPPPPPPSLPPFVNSIRIGPPPAMCPTCNPFICPGDSIPVTVNLTMPSPCYRFMGLELESPITTGPMPVPPVLVIRVDACPACFYCPPESIAYTAHVTMPPLPLGNYQLPVQERWNVISGPTRDTTFRAAVPFSVVDACSTSVPPSGPFVHAIQVGTKPCESCPPIVCPGDSIPVLISGGFPNGCWHFDGADVIYRRELGPAVLVKISNTCSPACPLIAPTFSAWVRMPPLPPGLHDLQVIEAIHVPCATPPDVDITHNVSFAVLEACSTSTPGCFVTDWEHSGDPCDAHVGVGHPAVVRMTVHTGIAPIAGLQGKLWLGWPIPVGSNAAPDLRITRIEGVGPAATWKVAWTPTPGGASFVAFSTDGTMIPPTDVWPPPSVLAITMETNGTPPTNAVLVASDVQASDPRGQQVPPCPTLDRLAVPTAHICAGDRLCDLNKDGTADIRDLVLMVHCILGYGFCPDSSVAGLDCNRDGVSTIDDVLCCAGTILHGGIPDSTARRAEPSIQVSVGTPVRNGSRIDVPIQILGADRVGAGRLLLKFPSDRFDLASVDAAGSQWLALGQANGSDLTVGVIGLVSSVRAAVVGPLALTLHLDLKNGQAPGGELRLATGEFSGPDGVALDVAVPPAVMPMDGLPRLVIAAPQPNPFSRETRFSITLPPRTSRLEVTIHDLAGRRVATVFRDGMVSVPENAANFSIPIRWAGTDDRGGRVRDGIYFVHARAGTQDITRKIILLRGN